MAHTDDTPNSDRNHVVWSSLTDADKDELIANLVDTLDQYEEWFAMMRTKMQTASVAFSCRR